MIIKILNFKTCEMQQEQYLKLIYHSKYLLKKKKQTFKLTGKTLKTLKNKSTQMIAKM